MKTILLPLMVVSLLATGCDEKSSRGSSSKKKGSASAAAVAPAALIPNVPAVVVAPPAPVEPPAKAKPAMISLTCTSDHWHNDEEKALDDALQMAQYDLMKKLQSLDPPVMAKPSKARIRSEFLKNRTVLHPTAEQAKKLKDGGISDKRLQVMIDVELTESQVQHLRASDRVSDGIRGAGILMALLAALYGFIRLDAWTKGYLTMWLGFGALAAVAAVVTLVVI